MPPVASNDALMGTPRAPEMVNALRPLHLILWSVATALLLCATAWFVMGQRATGRLDPTMLVTALPILAAILVALLRQRGHSALLVALGAGAMTGAWALAAMTLWGQRVAVGQVLAALLVWVVSVALFSTALRLVPGRSRVARVAAIGALFVLAGVGAVGAERVLDRCYDPTPAERPRVAVLTSLPLQWVDADGVPADVGALAQGRARPSPLWTALSRHVQLEPLAAWDAVKPARTRLLIAHPPALAPQDLVALDAFVRDGGRAVILADALSSWEPPYPLGDVRNPPITSLLTPLLTHWGITMDAPPGDTPTQARIADPRDPGTRIVGFSVGTFVQIPAGCTANPARTMLHCRVGKGHVTLIADADLLAAPLWERVSGIGWRARTADTVAWLARALAQTPTDSARAQCQPVWLN